MSDFVPALGGIPSPQDYRDITLASFAPPVPTGVLPSSYEVDVSKLPIWHQRKIGACVGHAHAKYKQKLDELDENKVFPLSARFVYGMSKCLDGYAGEGTYPRVAMKVMADYGVVTEDKLPNDTNLTHDEYVLQRNIGNFQPYFEDAKKFKISSYASIDVKTINGIKNGIIQGNGFSALMLVGPEWYTNKDGVVTWNKDQILPIKPPSQVISGHQVYVYKYEDSPDGQDTKIFFINSWSSDWADMGKGWMWFSEYVNYIVEGWTAIDIPQELLDESHNLPPPDSFHYQWNTNMSYGQRNTDIKAMQKALQLEGVFPLTQECTGYYGVITADAVLKFWKKYGLASWWEVTFLRGRQAGPKTRAKLNELFK